MARCWLCGITHRKTSGESWLNPYAKGNENQKRYCTTCYGLFDYFTWGSRWKFTSDLNGD